MKRFTTLIFLTFTLGIIQLNAQKFKPFFTLGSNLTKAKLTGSGNSQIGTRLGLTIGSGVSVIINRKWESSMEFLYSQNGAYVNFSQIPSIALDKIKLHYIEVPLTLAYRFNIKKKKKTHFDKGNIGGGITYARLFKHKIIAIDGTNVTNDVQFEKENAILFNIAATSFFNESFALNGRFTLSTFGESTIALRMLYFI